MYFWSFGPNIGLSGPFGAMPDKKYNTNEDLGVGTDGEAFFTGRGKAKKITDGAERGTYCRHQLIEIICYSKGNLNSHCMK